MGQLSSGIRIKLFEELRDLPDLIEKSEESKDLTIIDTGRDIHPEEVVHKFPENTWIISRNPKTFETHIQNNDFEYFYHMDKESFIMLSQDLKGISINDGKIKIDYGIYPIELSRVQFISSNKLEPLENLDVNKSCLEELSCYIHSSNFSQDEIQSFLKLQAELTLNKISWSFLKNTNHKQKIETLVDQLLKEKYKDRPEIASEFENISKKSRIYISKALPLVKDILSAQTSQNDSVYNLVNSDLFLVSLYAEDETKAKNYGFSSDPKSISSILNFSALINSTFLNSKDRLTSQEKIGKRMLTLYIHNLKFKQNNLVTN
ncbi:MAG: hypothetical protein H6622_09780 [Halobacteriovoraceae bacterium]|nr:hypothetical protein [Halobacteriovoraceae bacterium]